MGINMIKKRKNFLYFFLTALIFFGQLWNYGSSSQTRNFDDVGKSKIHYSSSDSLMFVNSDEEGYDPRRDLFQKKKKDSNSQAEVVALPSSSIFPLSSSNFSSLDKKLEADAKNSPELKYSSTIIDDQILKYSSSSSSSSSTEFKNEIDLPREILLKIFSFAVSNEAKKLDSLEDYRRLSNLFFNVKQVNKEFYFNINKVLMDFLKNPLKELKKMKNSWVVSEKNQDIFKKSIQEQFIVSNDDDQYRWVWNAKWKNIQDYYSNIAVKNKFCLSILKLNNLSSLFLNPEKDDTFTIQDTFILELIVSKSPNLESIFFKKWQLDGLFYDRLAFILDGSRIKSLNFKNIRNIGDIKKNLLEFLDSFFIKVSNSNHEKKNEFRIYK
jgi:hypothetical protein